MVTGALSEANYEQLLAAMNREDNKKLTKNQTLDKDAFLKLMTTQLRHQDPLSPMDNKDMIAQMAQFSSVEQLANISASIEAGQTAANDTADGIFAIIERLDGMFERYENRFDSIESTNNEIVNQLMTLNKAMAAYE